MRRALSKAAAQLDISAVGVCRARVFDELTPLLEAVPVSLAAGSAAQRCNPMELMPGAKSIIVCLFSYNCGGEDSNLSRYARGKDYHLVAGEKLDRLAELLRRQGYAAECFCDTGIMCDRYLAYMAGLGFFGKNHALINSEYGSYTFIGSILTDAKIEPDAPLEMSCIGCGACIKACPGGALTEDGFAENLCASYLTQKKGELSGEERRIIKKSGSAWGCDICQSVCPHNNLARRSGICEFTNDLIVSLDEDMAVSNRDFRRRYSDRAFAWRGWNVIRRNLEILREDNDV